MNKLLASTTWSVVLKNVRRMVSFTAMLVTDHCVNNAETIIYRIQKQKPMKLSFIDTANISFLWRNANSIQHEMLICFVENAKLRSVLNAQQ